MLLTNKYFHNLVCTLVVAFPVLVLTLDHASGVIYLLLVLLAVILYPLLRKDLTFTQTEILLIAALLLFFFVAGIAILFGNDPSTGYRWFGKFFRLVLVIPLLLLFRSVKLSESQFWYGLVIGAIFCGIVALTEIYIGEIFGWGGGHVGRASGVTHPIMFGDIALTMGLMAFCGLHYFREKNNWQSILPTMAATMGIVASVLSGSRGSWIAIPALLLILLWSMRQEIPRKILAVIITIIIVAPISLYYMPGVNVAQRVDSTFEQFSNYQSATADKDLMGNPVGIRLEMWQASWTMFREQPLLGVGWGNYQKSAQQLVDNGERNPVITRYRHPHNQYLSSMVNSGIAGLVTTLLLLAIPLWIFYKAFRQQSRSTSSFGSAGIVLVVAYSLFGLTEGVFERNMMLNFYGFYLALITAMTLKKSTT